MEVSHLEIFNRPQPIVNSRQHLLPRTDILPDSLGAPDYWPLNGGWLLNRWPLNGGSTVYRVG